MFVNAYVHTYKKGRSFLQVILFPVVATEYHNMMLYFILPVVRHFLPTDYFNHFALLVTAITMLLSQPTHSEVCLADMLLEYFVKEMQPLYGY